MFTDPATWTVLIVEDEPDNLEIAETVLLFVDSTVYTAADGTEGLRQLETITPTFVLLDLSMPVMDGWEMLEQVRANPRLANLIVIALTAHAMDGDRERALQAGFDGYITKPFRIDTLLAAITKCLQEIEEARG
ncbi:MAG: response regulator [Chloroflexi bacterium]|nr:response regulator [Chloroflexota bacterium]